MGTVCGPAASRGSVVDDVETKHEEPGLRLDVTIVVMVVVTTSRGCCECVAFACFFF